MMTSRLLVALQVLLSASLVVSARTTLEHWPGWLVCIAGVALGLWAIASIGARRVKVMPEVRDDTELVTSGPYRFVRHPMYTALLTACLGLSFAPYAPWKIIVFVALVFVLARKAAIEERQLRDRFPEYASYSERTSRFVPFIW